MNALFRKAIDGAGREIYVPARARRSPSDDPCRPNQRQRVLAMLSDMK